MIFHQMSPLFGGLEIFVRGDGDVTIRRLRRSEAREIEEVRYHFSDVTRVAGLFEQVETSDLLTMTVEDPNKPPIVDANPPLILVRGSSGEQRIFETQMQAPSEGFEHIMMSFMSLEMSVSEASVVYYGAPVQDYYPVGFEWTRAQLGTRRNVSWAPSANADEMRKAEQEYEQARQLQLEEIRKQREQREQR
jgi:hypothetical protein